MKPVNPTSPSTDNQVDNQPLDLELNDLAMHSVEARNTPDAAAGCTTSTDLELIAAPPGMCCCCSCCV